MEETQIPRVFGRSWSNKAVLHSGPKPHCVQGWGHGGHCWSGSGYSVADVCSPRASVMHTMQRGPSSSAVVLSQERPVLWELQSPCLACQDFTHYSPEEKQRPWRAMKEPADSGLKASHHQVDLFASAQSSQTTLTFASLPAGLFRSLTQRVWLVFPGSGMDWHIRGPLIARWHQQTTLESPVSHQIVLRHCERPQLHLGAHHPCTGIRESGGNGFRPAQDLRCNLVSTFLQKCSFVYSVVMAVSILPNHLVTP